MRHTSTGNGKVVVNRSMSLDGFIAGPGHAMDWIFDFVAPWRLPDFTSYSPRNRAVKQSDAKPSPRLGGVTQALAESGSAAGSDTPVLPEARTAGRRCLPLNTVMKDPRLRTSAQVV